MKLIHSVVVSGFVVAALSLVPCQASMIHLGINGDAQVGSNFIDFGQYPNGAPYNFAPGYGSFEISLVNGAVFSSAGITTGEFGMIQSLDDVIGPITFPSPFITFNGLGSNLQLWATNIPAGSVGPFVLTDTPDGAVASFNIEGYIEETNSMSDVASFTGTFSATFNGESVAQLSGSLPVDTPFSATLTATTIPEPASLLLLGAGLTSLGIGRFWNTRKA